MRIVFKLKQIESSGLFVVVVGPSWISEKGCSENETTTQTFESAPFARCWNFIQLLEKKNNWFFLDDLDFGYRTFVL